MWRKDAGNTGSVLRPAYSPRLINVQVGTDQTGPAAIGNHCDDFWNVLTLYGGDETYAEADCNDSDNNPTPVVVDVVSTNGDYPSYDSDSISTHRLLDSYLWPPAGGTLAIEIYGLSSGTHYIYCYGVGGLLGSGSQRWNATFQVTSGAIVTGDNPQSTSSATWWCPDAWGLAHQYVRFQMSTTGGTAPVVIQVTGPSSEPIFNGLQITPY
jgi:hypothetical protein